MAGFVLVILGACGVPSEVGELHRQALDSERTAVGALNQLTNNSSAADVAKIRAQYEEAAGAAREVRERLRELLAGTGGGIYSAEKIAEASQLNDDLLRCHETLEERANEAFRFVQSGRTRRGTVKDVWGLVDPRTCFDELAPAWDVLLQ